MARMPADERRQKLLDAAWRVLRRDGINATTTRAVCAEAGMPQGAFHYCFTGRDEMLREVSAKLIDSMLGQELGPPDWSGSLEQSISRSLDRYWAVVEKHVELRVVLYEITLSAVRNQSTADLARYQYRRYLEVTEQGLVAMAAAWDMAWDLPVTVLARQSIAVLDGAALHYVVDRDSAAAQAMLRAFAADLARHATRRES